MEITVYRQKEAIRKSTCYPKDIEQIRQLGRWLFVQLSGQSFILRKTDLEESSAFYSFIDKSPSKITESPAGSGWGGIKQERAVC